MKNNLSRYLEQVKAGGEIVERDRNLAVARIVPVNVTASPDDELLRLAALGKIRLGEGTIGDDYWRLRLPRVKPVRAAPPDLLQCL